MNHHEEELRQAMTVHGMLLRGELSEDAALVAAVDLAESGVWSLRHLALITGLTEGRIARKVALKAERTGGRFNPESLPHMLNAIEGRRRDEPIQDEVAQAVTLGTGPYLVSRLTGIPASSVKWYCARAHQALGGAA